MQHSRGSSLVTAIGTSLALLASGCSDDGGSSQSQPTKTVTVTAEPSESDEPEATDTTESADPFAPNVGERALKVGQTRKGRAISSTLLEVKRPMVHEILKPDEANQEFMGLRVKTCVKAGEKQPVDVGWRDWAAVTKDGATYPGSSSSWDSWPQPVYPSYRALAAGECATGWLLVPLLKTAKAEKVILGAQETAAEWML